jgi:hypothetical protein
MNFRKALLAVMITNLIGALLNMFGAIFELPALIIAAAVLVGFALIGAIICVISALK